jgi:hypothetical protein
MATLRTYLNAKIKEKGSTLAKEKAKAGKYKSIAAAKKAGALYYTNKEGKVMAAVYAEDLKKPLTSTLRPKARPKKEPPVAKTAAQPKVTVTKLKPRKDDPEVKKIVDDTKKALTRREQALQNAINKPGNEAARKAVEKFGPLTAIERAKLRAAEKKKNKKK